MGKGRQSQNIDALKTTTNPSFTQTWITLKQLRPGKPLLEVVEYSHRGCGSAIGIFAKIGKGYKVMARGRPQKNPAQRRLDGNPGHRPIIEPCIIGIGSPSIPDHLSDDAKTCMRQIVATMPPGTYTASDTYLLAAFGMAWATHRRASEALRVEPLLVNGRRGNAVPSPWLRILNAQARLMATLGSVLYLDPRARLSLNISADRPPSPFSGLLGGKNLT